MRVIAKAPNKAPIILEMKNTLEELQEAVGGYIETVSFASYACIVCNEEGRLKDMPFNCKICGLDFFGPVLIVGVNGDAFTDLYRPESTARLLFGECCV